MRTLPLPRPLLWSALALLAALAWAFAVPAAAQAPRPATQPVLPGGMEEVTTVEGITEYRLPNGLQLLLVPDDSKPTTTVNLTVRVGSRHENYGETGMAHLLEHMLFKGTPTTREPWAEFTRRGLRANGTTWFDRTNYFASFAANDDNLRWYLGWLADAMVNSLILREDLDSEMTVVRNEMEAGENNPGRIALQRLLATMYEWHNYGKSTIGARSDVENVDIPRLQAFYRLHYQPDNVTLTVTGRFDTERVRAWVAAGFGPIPRPDRPRPVTYTLDPPQDGERVVTVRRVGGTPLIYMGYHVPPGAHPDFAVASLLASVLGDTPGGRLHRRVVEQGLAAQAFGAAWGLEEPGPLLLGLGLAPGQDLDKARAAAVAVVDGLAAEPVTAEELERARTAWLNAWDDAFADPETVGVALSEAISGGDWRLFFLGRDQVRRVTLEDMQRVARTYLVPDNRSVALYLPSAQPQRAPAPARVDVAALLKGYTGDAATAVAEAFDATPAHLDARTQVFSGPAGLRVALLPKGTRGGAVQARLRLHYGSADTLKGQATTAALMAGLLDKGGAGMTRQQIADAFDRLRASVGFSASGQVLTVQISTRREQLPEVVALVARLLREPGFEAAPLEEARRLWLAGIERQRKEPEAVIANRIGRHGNPYPRGDLRHVASFDEMEADVRAVTLQGLGEFHRRFLSAAHGEFAAVGDLDVAAVRAALQRGFDGWQRPAAGPMPWVRVPLPVVPVPAARFVELTPDKANANLMGRLSLRLSDRDADHAAVLLANYIFGLGGNSRLWTRIREREGLSYDVRSFIDWNPHEAHSSWTVTAIFAPENQPRVEKALSEELQRSLAEGFTQDELDQGRQGLLNFRRLSRAQDSVVAGALAGNLHLQRRFAFAQQVDEAIEKMSLAQLNAAWRRHIRPAELVLAWGGDFRKAP
jgi:zinc protease